MTEVIHSPQNPWATAEALSSEITVSASPIDYTELIGGHAVLMLGEHHRNSHIRDHIARNAIRLREAGITHYAIEAPHNPAFDKLNEHKYVSLAGVDLGPFSSLDGSYERAVQAMAVQGIKVTPIDIDHSTKLSPEEREAFLAKGIEVILAEQPDAKVATLIDELHTSKRKRPHSPPSMTVHLLASGIEVIAANYAGGTGTGPSVLLDAASHANMSRREFMMDLRPHKGNASVIYEPGAVDYVIHLPQSTPSAPLN